MSLRKDGLGAADDTLIVCPFRRVTGGYCPSCGVTRAVLELVRLDVRGANREHPLVLSLPISLLALVVGTRRDGGPTANIISGSFSALWLGVWFVRLARSSIPRPGSGRHDGYRRRARTWSKR